MYCKACNNYVGYKRKKPATTFTTVDSVTKESVIEGFPKKEEEDLCNTCLLSIRDMNSDLSKVAGHLFFDMAPSYILTENYQDKFETELSEVTLDTTFRYVEDVYNGYK